VCQSVGCTIIALCFGASMAASKLFIAERTARPNSSINKLSSQSRFLWRVTGTGGHAQTHEAPCV